MNCSVRRVSTLNAGHEAAAVGSGTAGSREYSASDWETDCGGDASAVSGAEDCGRAALGTAGADDEEEASGGGAAQQAVLPRMRNAVTADNILRII